MGAVGLGYVMLVIGAIATVALTAGPLVAALTLAFAGIGLMLVAAWGER